MPKPELLKHMNIAPGAAIVAELRELRQQNVFLEEENELLRSEVRDIKEARAAFIDSVLDAAPFPALDRIVLQVTSQNPDAFSPKSDEVK